MKAKLIVCVLMAVVLTGCASFNRRLDYYSSNTPDLDQVDVREFVDAQAAIFDEFVALAEVDENVSDWRPVVDTGMHYVDIRCDRFMDALAYFNRIRESSSRQIQHTSASASAILSLINASTDLLGITPLGFAYLDQTVNNIGRSMLYEIPPGAVLGLVRRQRTAYREGIANISYKSRGAAMQAIHGYVRICLPASIEAEVTRSIEAREFSAIPYAREAGDTANAAQVAADVAADAAEEAADAAADAQEAAEDATGNLEDVPPPNTIPEVDSPIGN